MNESNLLDTATIESRAVVQSEGRNDIGRNIRYMRELRSWSQSELARRAGLSRTTIRRIEEGMPCWRPTLERLAEVFSIPVYEFCNTDRFQNILQSDTDYVVHRPERNVWHARGDKRNTLPADNDQVIQDPLERQRLGRLGFVPVFMSWMDFYLPVGPGIIQFEVYGRHEQRYMPQFTAASFYVLSGEVKITVAGKTEILGPGHALAYDSLKTVCLEPVEKYVGGKACELILVGSLRRKVE